MQFIVPAQNNPTTAPSNMPELLGSYLDDLTARNGPNASALVSALRFQAALFEYLMQGAQIRGNRGFVEFDRPMSQDRGFYTVDAATPQREADFAGCQAIALINGPFNPNTPTMGILARQDFRLICYAIDRNDAQALGEYLQGRLVEMRRDDLPMKGQCFQSIEIMPGLSAPTLNNEASLWLVSLGFRVQIALAGGC